MGDVVFIKDLVKEFPMAGKPFRALDRITLMFSEGEFAGLVGPSGSGKTTLLNIIGTLDTPSSGTVKVLGHQTGRLSHRQAARLRNEKIGFIFQTFNLFPVYTVYENVEFPLLLQKVPGPQRKKRVHEALEWVGLTDKINMRPASLSGGEAQRVAIARAIVKRPALVLADEPTANLDVDNSHHILRTMEKINRHLNTTFIFATHDEKVIGYLRRKITLEDGRVRSDEVLAKNEDSGHAAP